MITYGITTMPDGLRHCDDTPYCVFRESPKGIEVVAKFHSRYYAIEFAKWMNRQIGTLAQAV